MDLGTIKNKLEKGKYTDAADCADDVHLVWRNCMMYNANGSDIYCSAESYSRTKLVDKHSKDVVCDNVTVLGSGENQSSGFPRRKKLKEICLSQTSSPQWKTLPGDIPHSLVSHLSPPSDVVHFSRTCKAWHSQIVPRKTEPVTLVGDYLRCLTHVTFYGNTNKEHAFKIPVTKFATVFSVRIKANWVDVGRTALKKVFLSLNTNAHLTAQPVKTQFLT